MSYTGPSSTPTAAPTGDPPADLRSPTFIAALVTMMILLFQLVVWMKICEYLTAMKAYRLSLSGKMKNYLKNLPEGEYINFLANIRKDPYIGLSHDRKGDGKFEDFVRLVVNEHPLISCFLADPCNYYDLKARINVFVLGSAFQFLFFGTLYLVRNNSGGDIVSILKYVAFPLVVYLVQKISYYLIILPCFRSFKFCQQKKFGCFRELSVTLPCIVISFSLIFAGSQVVDDAGLTPLNASIQIIFDFFILSILGRSVIELIMLSLLFVDTHENTFISRSAHVVDNITCGFLAIGIWFKIKKEYDNKPRIFLLDDGTELTNVEKMVWNPLTDIVENAKLERRISLEGKERQFIVPGFEVEMTMKSSFKDDKLQAVTPGFSVMDESVENENGDGHCDPNNTVAPGFRLDTDEESRSHDK